MIDRVLPDAVSSKPILVKRVLIWEPFAVLYARFALGAAFLSAVAADDVLIECHANFSISTR
jgi:hypothetical protein